MSKIQSKNKSGSIIAAGRKINLPTKKIKKTAATTKTVSHPKAKVSNISFGQLATFFSQLLTKLKKNVSQPQSIIKIFGGLLAIMAIFLIASKLLTDRYWPFTANSGEPFVRNTDFDQIFGQPAQPLTERQQIAQKAIDCLDKKMKDERGIYFHGMLCNSNNACEFTQSNQENTYPIWLKLKLFSLTHDANLFNSILADAQNVANKVSSIQNIIWNARQVAKSLPMLTSLYQQGALNRQELDNLTTNLFQDRIIYYYDDLTAQEINDLSLKPTVIDPLKFQTELANSNYQSPNFNLKEKRFYYISNLPSEYLGRFQLTNDPTDLKKAIYFFDQSLELIKEDSATVPLNYYCLTGISALDFYNFYPDLPQYSQIAEILYQHRDLKATSLIQSDSLEEKATCAYFAKQLYESTKNDYYKNEFDKLMNHFLNQHLLADDKKWGSDYCFESDIIIMHNTQLRDRKNYPNSLIIDLLLDS